MICAAITSRMSKAKLPTHVVIDSRCCSIVKDSVVLLEQLRTIDKQRLREKVCHLEEDMIRQIDEPAARQFRHHPYIDRAGLS